jgi:hypothetical protein
MTRAIFIGLALVVAFAATSAAQPRPGPAAAARSAIGASFVDANGDGICDRFQTGQALGPGQGQGRRVGNGTHPRPQNGTGLGPGPSAGTGICDGTGPKGRATRRAAR